MLRLQNQITLLLLVACFYSLFSQNTYPSSLIKYWNYRYRMVGDLVEKERLPKLGEEGFIKLNLEKVGNMSANGYFHPFLGRQRFCCFRYTENGNCDSNNGAWSWNYYFYDNNSGGYRCNHSFAGNQYGFNGYVYPHNKVYGSTNPYLGNANMGIYLTDDGGTPGFYLCVLATEYDMLKNSFHESRATAEELWQVLNLFDRLDYMGEVVFGKPPKVDGFFIRNDIPEDFLRNGEFGKNYTLTTIYMLAVHGKMVVMDL